MPGVCGLVLRPSTWRAQEGVAEEVVAPWKEGAGLSRPLRRCGMRAGLR